MGLAQICEEAPSGHIGDPLLLHFHEPSPRTTVLILSPNGAWTEIEVKPSLSQSESWVVYSMGVHEVPALLRRSHGFVNFFVVYSFVSCL